MLRVFNSRVLRNIFGPEREEVTGDWDTGIMRRCMIPTAHQILLG
jgi:hypothetical protein